MKNEVKNLVICIVTTILVLVIFLGLMLACALFISNKTIAKNTIVVLGGVGIFITKRVFNGLLNAIYGVYLAKKQLNENKENK